jgi:hypothetical protein
MQQTELSRLLHQLITTWENEVVEFKQATVPISTSCSGTSISDALTDKQKTTKISTLLTKLRKQGNIENIGSDADSCWQLTKRN